MGSGEKKGVREKADKFTKRLIDNGMKPSDARKKTKEIIKRQVRRGQI